MTIVSRRRVLTAAAGGFAFSHRSWSEDATPEPLTAAVYGDSQAEGLAVALLAAARGSRFRVINRTKAATALGQSATYDWVRVVQASVAKDHPAIAVMMFGGNDRVPARLPDGRALPFRGEPWLAYYRDRLQALISALTAAGTSIVWCGDPSTRDARYANDMAYLNSLYRDALPASDATFVDIWDVAAGLAGAYISHGPGPDGAVQRLRTDDGIHFTAAGYGLVALRVLRAMQDIITRKHAPAAAEPPGEEAGERPPKGGTAVPVAEPQTEIHARAAHALHREF
jgi:hypothetical protein